MAYTNSMSVYQVLSENEFNDIVKQLAGIVFHKKENNNLFIRVQNKFASYLEHSYSSLVLIDNKAH